MILVYSAGSSYITEMIPEWNFAMRLRQVYVVLGLLLPTLPAARSVDPPTDELIAAFEKKVNQIAETHGPAVVQIVVSRSDKYLRAGRLERDGQLDGFDPQEFVRADPARAALAKKLDLSDRENIPDNALANGVVIDATGFVLTTYGAIEGATKLYVRTSDGKGSYADIHAADARSDFAVLRLLSPPPGLQAAPIGEARPDDLLNGPRRNLFRGKLLVLLGWNAASTGQINSPSPWLGSLAGIQRRVIPQNRSGSRDDTWYRYGFVLEYQTVLRPAARGVAVASLGMNGIPLFTLDGEVIGFTSMLAGPADADPGPGYALPIDRNGKRIIEVLRRGEEVEYGFLGVTIPNPPGSILSVLSVTPNSPAAQAGIQKDDIISHINGAPANRFEDLLLHAGTSLAGTKIRLHLRVGNNQIREVDVTLAKYKNEAPYIASKRPEPVFGLRVDYSSISSQNPRGSASGAVPPGVAIREVLANSPAAAKFKTLGDEPNRWAIVAVNGTRTPNPADFYKAARGQPSVKLTLLDIFDQNPQEREVTIP